MNRKIEKVPPGGWKLIKHSLSKMIVWFADHNVRTMYSIDWRSRYSKFRNRETGLKRLRKKVDIYGEQASTVEIYDKATGQLIEKYIRGEKKEI
ncbi:hypothetical protein JMN32_14935 [Fulvivirga sp. 29W222]|uniref:Uncharacterized protein n=1 Tax=Fulvivirga marina TaxID=2494733 RepID=A0A937G380_9BACT|nr:hypothetical protein [Fulvivirga marina]MBL6447611.1 hypothetical protein [Fulvivirga marina]